MQFIPAQDIAHNKIIRPIVAESRGAFGQSAALADDDLVGVQQPRELHRDLFASARRALNLLVATSAAMAMLMPPSN